MAPKTDEDEAGREADPEAPAERRARLLRFLEETFWSRLPPDQLGKPHDQALDDEILGDRK